jgi:hypothetical protein
MDGEILEPEVWRMASDACTRTQRSGEVSGANQNASFGWAICVASLSRMWGSILYSVRDREYVILRKNSFRLPPPL